MSLSSTLKRVEQIDKKARQERQTSPQIIQKTKAVRHPSGSDIHKAFCKTDAGGGNTLTCYLDTDETGTEITVHFNISPSGSNLSDSIRRLSIGNQISIAKIDDDWWCTEGFQKIDSDQLQVDATDGLQTKLDICE